MHEYFMFIFVSFTKMLSKIAILCEKTIEHEHKGWNARHAG